MRRLVTVLSFIGAIIVIGACSSVFSVVQGVVNAPGAIVSAVAGPGDTIGFPVRYETRPNVTQELILRADGTYTRRSVKDSAVLDTGRYTWNLDTLKVGICLMQLSPSWAKGDCFGKGLTWRESPQNLRWPKQPAKPDPTAKTALLLPDRRRLGLVSVPV